MSSGCVQTLLLTTSNCIMWTINSISFWQVGIKMPNYPIFANWIGIVPYLFIIPYLSTTIRILPGSSGLIFIISFVYGENGFNFI
jgi:hypothetical protein